MADGDDSRSLISAQDAGPVTVAPRSVDTLAGIQMLRAIASIAVVIYHALDQSYGAKHHFPVTWMMMPGAAGVDIFFVISGLIMFHVTFGAGKSPISPVEFLKRRVLRIYPLYWILLLPFFAARAAGFLHNSPLTNTQVLTSFLLLPDTKRLMFPAWTLVYEMYFYAVFAVMLEQGRSELAVQAGLPVGTGSQSLVIVRLELDFVAEMAWPGEVRIETEVLRLGGRSFTMQQRLVSAGALCGKAQTVLVVMDREARKAVSIDPWREALGQWMAPG